MASVLLCTDEPILAEGLTRVLAPIEGLDLVSWCKGVDELRALLELHQPDVLLVDMTSEVTFTVLLSFLNRHKFVQGGIWNADQ